MSAHASEESFRLSAYLEVNLDANMAGRLLAAHQFALYDVLAPSAVIQILFAVQIRQNVRS